MNAEAEWASADDKIVHAYVDHYGTRGQFAGRKVGKKSLCGRSRIRHEFGFAFPVTWPNAQVDAKRLIAAEVCEDCAARVGVES